MAVGDFDRIVASIEDEVVSCLVICVNRVCGEAAIVLRKQPKKDYDIKDHSQQDGDGLGVAHSVVSATETCHRFDSLPIFCKKSEYFSLGEQIRWIPSNE